ncbi:MAG: divergent PAP2 family protein [Lachnospiraceae bacterium]|nr:divergent PAP2 family protein [Lachnospiraceae bacterium]
MEFFTELIHNPIILSAAGGWFVAQISKTILHTVMTKNFDAERLVGTGGMPSSHSATVCGLATAVCYQYGAGGVEFALAAAFAMIVMYDALGVRRQAGKQASVLNEMIDTISKMGIDTDISAEDKLKEFVGHSPLQVAVGAIVGILIALLVCNLLPAMPV